MTTIYYFGYDFFFSPLHPYGNKHILATNNLTFEFRYSYFSTEHRVRYCLFGKGVEKYPVLFYFFSFLISKFLRENKTHSVTCYVSI